MKTHINQMIWKHKKDRWKAVCLMYKELDHYNISVSHIKTHPWWLFVKDEPIYFIKVAGVLSILMGGQPSKYQRNFNSSMCKICNSHASETVEHILFEYKALETYRNKLWDDFASNLLDPMKHMILEMPHRDRAVFLLSCLNESYVREWRYLYGSLADYIYKLYVHRALKYDELCNDVEIT